MNFVYCIKVKNSYDMPTIKPWNFETWILKFLISRMLELLNYQMLELLKSWNLEFLNSRNLNLSNSWILGFLNSRNLETLNSGIVELLKLLKSWNLDTLNSWIPRLLSSWSLKLSIPWNSWNSRNIEISLSSSKLISCLLFFIAVWTVVR